MNITSLKLRLEDSYLAENAIVVAEIETLEGFTYFASLLEDGWHVYFACHEEDAMPLWSHGVEALGVAKKTFADERISRALSLIVAGHPDYDLDVDHLVSFNRAMLTVEGQMDLFEEC